MGADGKGTGQKPVSEQQRCPCPLPAGAKAKIFPANAGRRTLAVGSALPPPQLGNKSRTSAQLQQKSQE